MGLDYLFIPLKAFRVSLVGCCFVDDRDAKMYAEYIASKSEPPKSESMASRLKL
jgi:hypothetical protein